MTLNPPPGTPAHTPTTTPPSAPQHAPVRPNNTGATLSVLLACLAALVALGGAFLALAAGTTLLNNTMFHPTHTATTYMRALSEGNANIAEQLTNASELDPGAAQLSAEMLRNASARIESATVLNSTITGPNATIRVRYHIEETAYESTLHLHRDREAYGLINIWRLSERLTGTLTILNTEPLSAEYTVNGVPVGTSLNGLPIYPGRYSAEAAFNSAFFLDGSDSTVVSENTASLGVTPQPTPALTAAAQTQLNAFLDVCASETQPRGTAACEMTPEETPITQFESVTRSVIEYPTITLSPDASSFTTTGGSIEITQNGSDASGRSGTVVFQSSPEWMLSGTLSVTTDSVRLNIDVFDDGNFGTNA